MKLKSPRRKLWMWICRNFLFTWFCKHVVPYLKYMEESDFELIEGPNFIWTKNGFVPRTPGTEAIYQNRHGMYARLRVELYERRNTEEG